MSLALAAAALSGTAGCTLHVTERKLLAGAETRLAERPETARRKNVTIVAADGAALRGFRIVGTGGGRPAVYFCGNRSSSARVEPALEWLSDRLHADVEVVDYRGYGASDGAATLRAISDDAPLVFDDLARRSGARPWVVGVSLGAAVALHVGAVRDAAGVIAIAPPPSIDDMVPGIERRVPFWLAPFVAVRVDDDLRAFRPRPYDDAAHLRAPLGLLLGTDDDIVPYEAGRRLFAQAHAPDDRKFLCTVRGGAHEQMNLFEPATQRCFESALAEIAPRERNTCSARPTRHRPRE